MSARDLLLLQVVEELHPVVGGQFSPPRGLQDADIAGLGRLGCHLRVDLTTPS